jgi:hypothetical protein
MEWCGFVDLSLPDKGQQQVLAQPSLMYRFDKNLSAGIEYQIYLNKGYISKNDEVVPQLRLILPSYCLNRLQWQLR